MGFRVEVGDEPARAGASADERAPAAIAEAGRLLRDHLLVGLANEAPGSQLVPFRWRTTKTVLEADIIEIATFDGHPFVQTLGPVLRHDQHLRHDILLPPSPARPHLCLIAAS